MVRMLDKELLEGFQEESRGLLAELEAVVEALEEVSGRFPSAELEQFAQRIDRIMGAAQTLNQLEAGHLGLVRIGALAQLCKRLGYKASESKREALVPIFAAFWADTLEVLSELVDNLQDEARSKVVANAFATTLEKRLTWLGEKLQKMAPAAAPGPLGSQLQVDAILAKLK
jgi:chemotaxis protein histidine kinase CheA